MAKYSRARKTQKKTLKGNEILDSNGNPIFIDQRFSPKIITTASVGYDLSENVNLTIGANNLFDVYPDENREAFRSGERFVYSRRATQFGFNGGYYFARLNVTPLTLIDYSRGVPWLFTCHPAQEIVVLFS